MNTPSQSVRQFILELGQLQTGMLSDLATQSWDGLVAKDNRCRALYKDLDTERLSKEDIAALKGSMEVFLEFHRELQLSCVEQRDSAAREMEQVRSAASGIAAYDSVKSRP